MSENESVHIPQTQDTLIKSIFNDSCLNISKFLHDSEAESKAKYEAKLSLIESATDMSTQQKLDALDKSYECRNQERHQNLSTTIFILGLLTTYLLASKNVAKHFC